jgi:hypothetical protein
MPSKPAATNPYRSAASDKFKALKTLYASNNTLPSQLQVSFWKLGNSFDTMIDFLDTIDDSSAHDVAQMAVTQLEASLTPLGGYDKAWFDDFGWWSIATQRALQKPFFKQDAPQLQNILNQCWPRFTNNAPFVWQRRKPGKFEDYAPAVDGGVWNAYWEDTPETYPGPKTGDPSNGDQPGTQKTVTLIGIQNTVTNALYLMAAQRLGHTDPAARQAAERELKFLLTWFDEKAYSLWRKIDKTTGLVLERVGHFANGKRAKGFQEDWAWTGDQGLILGALNDAMLSMPPNFRGPLLDRAKHLLSGVRQRLVDDSGIVLNYTTEGAPPDDDTPDYQVGAGVFWRNALYVWKNNAELRTVLAGSEYQRIVRASADAAAEAPLEGTTETLTNQTAVLVAATAMLE